MASKELQIALKLLAQTSEFQAQIARAEASVTEFGAESAEAGKEAESGMKRAEKATGGVRASFENAAETLKGFIAGFVGLQTVQGIIKLTDDYSSLNAQLNLATDSQETFLAAQSQTFAIAQRSRTDLSATVELYTKLQKSFNSLGGSQAEALKVTEAITKSFAISGASAESSAAAITQFAQGLNKGVLSGDELNSVLEQSPRLSKALADGMGVSEGALKDLGEQGKITAEAIKNALLGQGDAIAAEFAQIPLKFSDAMTQLENAATIAFGQIFDDAVAAGAVLISEVSGSTDVFANGLAQLPQTLSVVVQEVISFFEIMYIGAREQIQQLTLSVAERWLDIQTGALILSGAVELIFAKLVAAIAAKLVPLAQTISSLGAKVGFDTSGIDGFVRGLGVLTTAEQSVTRAIDARSAAIQIQREALLDQRKEFEETASAEILASLSQVQVYKDQAAAELAGVAASNARTAGTKKSTAATAEQTAATKKAAEAAEQYAKLIRDLEAQERDHERALIAQEVAQSLAAKAVTDFLPSLAKETEFLKLSSDEREVVSAGLRAEAQYRKLVTDAVKLGAAEYVNLTEAQKDAGAQAARLAGENEKISQQFTEQAQRTADETTRIFEGAGKSASDAFADSLLNGFSGLGDSLKNIWKNLIRQMLSAQIEKSLFAPFIAQLQGAFSGLGGAGGAGGGIGGLLSGLFGGGGAGGGLGNIFSTITGFGGGSPAGAGGGFLGAVPSLFGSLGAGLSSVIGGLGGFSSALTIAGTSGIGAATSIGFSSLAAGSFAQGIGALIPVVGQIAAVAGIINSLSGGRLFGTKFTTNSAGSNFSFGADGASGNNFAEQSRRRSLFRGTARRTVTSALSADQLSGLQDIQANAEAVGRATASAVGRAFVGVVAAEFKTTVDKDGKVLSQIGRALGAEYKVSIDEFARVISAETAIAQLPDVASDIAQKFRGSVESIVDASQFLVTAQAQISAGQGLFTGDDALQLAADAVERLGTEGETLLASYTRISAATSLYDQALALTGQATKLARDAVVDFATGIVEAAGGLDQAAALYQRFFAVAYSDQERGLAQLSAAEARRNTLLAEAGLSADTTIANLRASIEELLRTGGDPEKLVLLLQTVDAIANVADVTAQLGNTAAAAAAELADAVASVGQFATELDGRFTALTRSGFTDFERALLSIDDQLQQDVAQLQRTRAELVKRNASTAQLAEVDRQLARAHQFAAAAAVQAINQLRAQGRALIAQLRGGRASNAAAIEAQSFSDAGTQAFADIGQAAQQAYEAQLAGLKSIQEYLDGQLLGNLSSLTPEQRLAEAQAQFNRALLAAQGGDADALRRLTQLADTVLREGRAFDPSAFPDLEASIRAALQALVNAGPVAPPPPIGGPIGGPTGGTGVTGGPLDDSAEAFAASQAELSLQIAEIIRQLIGATGDSLAEVAATLGLNITELVSALGINLEALTAGSVQSLGSLANALGVELTDLAGEVGAELGNLADAQSLLNDALEAEIAALPQSQRDQLQPLLDAVEESANNPEGLAIAQAALEAKIRAIGGDAANKLAPYFADIDPIDPLLSIDGALRTGFADVVAAINNIGTLTPSQPEGSFAVGTSFVPRDMLANIHQGEAVIDADSMRVLRQYGVRVVTPQGGGDGVATGALISELRQLRTEVQTLRATVARGDERNVMATLGAAEMQSAASDRIARAQNQGRRVMS